MIKNLHNQLGKKHHDHPLIDHSIKGALIGVMILSATLVVKLGILGISFLIGLRYGSTDLISNAQTIIECNRAQGDVCFKENNCEQYSGVDDEKYKICKNTCYCGAGCTEYCDATCTDDEKKACTVQCQDLDEPAREQCYAGCKENCDPSCTISIAKQCIEKCIGSGGDSAYCEKSCLTTCNFEPQGCNRAQGDVCFKENNCEQYSGVDDEKYKICKNTCYCGAGCTEYCDATCTDDEKKACTVQCQDLDEPAREQCYAGCKENCDPSCTISIAKQCIEKCIGSGGDSAYCEKSCLTTCNFEPQGCNRAQGDVCFKENNCEQYSGVDDEKYKICKNTCYCGAGCTEYCDATCTDDEKKACTVQCQDLDEPAREQCYAGCKENCDPSCTISIAKQCIEKCIGSGGDSAYCEKSCLTTCNFEPQGCNRAQGDVCFKENNCEQYSGVDDEKYKICKNTCYCGAGCTEYCDATCTDDEKKACTVQCQDLDEPAREQCYAGCKENCDPSCTISIAKQCIEKCIGSGGDSAYCEKSCLTTCNFETGTTDGGTNGGTTAGSNSLGGTNGGGSNGGGSNGGTNGGTTAGSNSLGGTNGGGTNGGGTNGGTNGVTTAGSNSLGGTNGGGTNGGSAPSLIHLHDPYQCKGPLFGQLIIDSNSEKIIQIQLYQNNTMKYEYLPSIDSNGNYSIGLQTTNSQLTNYVEEGTYEIRIFAKVGILSEQLKYTSFITDTCEHQSPDIKNTPIVQSSMYELLGESITKIEKTQEHESPQAYKVYAKRLVDTGSDRSLDYGLRIVWMLMSIVIGGGISYIPVSIKQ